MKFRLLFTGILLCCANFIFSQNLVQLKGRVTDQQGQALIGANIYISELQKGTVANSDGEYLITELEKANYTVVVTYVGFISQEKRINIKSNTVLNFSLAEGIVLDGLVVTAQKREQSIKDIPTALSSLSINLIENTGTSEIDGLAEYIPGMQVQLQSPNNPGFVVRGITSDDGASNIEPRVSVFQDGVSISKSRGSVVEVFDMERIEVLKGPQGTLFGRGAQIGAVHFIQNKATNNKSGSVTVGYGDYNYKMAKGHYNMPLVSDKLFARFAGIYKERDGFIRNSSGGRLNGKDTKAVRASLRFLASRSTSFNLIYNYQQDDPPGTAFKSGTYAPKGGDTKAWTFADLDKGKDLGLDRTVWGVTLQGKHFFTPNLSLTSITAYREFDSYESFDADGTAAPALWFAEDAFGKQMSQELRLNVKLGDKLEAFAGGNYFWEDGYQKVPFTTDERSFFTLLSPMLAQKLNSSLQALGTELLPTPLVNGGMPVLPSTGSELLKNPLPPLEALPASVQQQVAPLYAILKSPLLQSHSEYYKNYGQNRAFEFFADGTYQLFENLKLTAGMRMSMEKIETSYEAGQDTKNAHLGFARNAGPNILFMPVSKTSEQKTFTSWVGRFAVNYSVSKEVEVYSTFSRGRRPNVIQFTSKPNNDAFFTSRYESQVLNDEVVNSYELGTKALLLGKSLYFDLAAYYYDYKDFQTSTIDPVSLQAIVKDAGDASSYGFETSFKWQINKNTNLFGNYAYIHAEFDDEDSEGNKQELSGKTFRLTPKHSFAFGVDLKMLVTEACAFFLRPTYNYKSKLYFEESNLDLESQKAFGLLHVRTGCELPKQNLRFTIFVTNALDEKYIIDAGNTGRNFGIPTYIAGAPRMFGAELNFRF